MPVRVVTDSTSDIPPELVAELGITVVPLQVIFGSESLRDGVDIGVDEFYGRLASSDALPTTSQPSIGDFEEVYRRLGSETNEIVSIHLSAKLSGTMNSALVARASFAQRRIEVIDSRSASLGCGIAVVKAAQAAQAGEPIERVCAVAHDAIASQRIAFTVDSLDQLRRGGRLGRGAAFLGSVLSIKPILEIRGGEIYPAERVRTRKRALDRLVEWAEAEGEVTDVAVVHGAAPDDAEKLRSRLAERFPKAALWTGRVGPVLGAHVGPTVIGVMTLGKRGAT